MSYKITRKDRAYVIGPKHFDVRTTRLHDPQDVNNGVVTMGLSHFLPGGVDMAQTQWSPYTTIEGQMYIEEVELLMR